MFGQFAWSIPGWGWNQALELHMHDLKVICLYRMSWLPEMLVGVFKPGSGCVEVQVKLSPSPPVHSMRLAWTDMKHSRCTKCVSTLSVFLSPALTPNLRKCADFSLVFQKIICCVVLRTGAQLKQITQTSYFLHHQCLGISRPNNLLNSWQILW